MNSNYSSYKYWTHLVRMNRYKMGASVSHDDHEVAESNATQQLRSKPASSNTQNDNAVSIKRERQDPEVHKTIPTIQLRLPHSFEEIVKDADSSVDRSSMENLYGQLHAGIWLNQKRKKYWIEGHSNSNCFMLYARALSITWSEEPKYWHWSNLEETSGTLVDVAELLNVCWLEVHGKFETKKLSPGILYEVAFLIMLKDPAYGWDIPVNVRLVLPGGKKQEKRVSLMDKPRGKWISISVGEFTAPVQEIVGEMEVSMYEYEGGKWKRGLVIKGIIIQPKN